MYYLFITFYKCATIAYPYSIYKYLLPLNRQQTAGILIVYQFTYTDKIQDDFFFDSQVILLTKKIFIITYYSSTCSKAVTINWQYIVK